MSSTEITVKGTNSSYASVKAMDVSMTSVNSGGVLNTIFDIPKASDKTLGGVKIPTGGSIKIDDDGNISVNIDALPTGNEVSY